MRAVCWEGKEKIQVETVPDPVILNPRDAIIKVTTTAICGSDLHIYDGYIPTMHKGDVLGHEFMGEVVEVGKENTRLEVGDRVVVPFTIACGRCYFCREQLWSLSSAARLTPPSSSRIASGSKTRRRCTARFATKTTRASKSSSHRVQQLTPPRIDIRTEKPTPLASERLSSITRRKRRWSKETRFTMHSSKNCATRMTRKNS
jgi:Zn-dependent alcohol dehydrogenase